MDEMVKDLVPVKMTLLTQVVGTSTPPLPEEPPPKKEKPTEKTEKYPPLPQPVMAVGGNPYRPIPVAPKPEDPTPQLIVSRAAVALFSAAAFALGYLLG